MKKMMKFIAIAWVCVAIGMSSVTAASLGGEVTGGREIRVIAAEGPASGAELQTYWANGVTSIRDTGNLPPGYKILSSIGAENISAGKAVHIFYDVKAGAGETVALYGGKVVVWSSDSAHVLSETNTFGAGRTYSSGAILVRDGQTITSGTTAQAGQRLIFAVGLIHFSNTQEVRDYLNAYPGWNVNVKLYFDEQLAASTSYATALPRASFRKVGGDFILSLENTGGSQDFSYATSPVLGPQAQWTVRGQIRGGQSLTNAFGPMTGPTLFVRIQQ